MKSIIDFRKSKNLHTLKWILYDIFWFQWIIFQYVKISFSNNIEILMFLRSIYFQSWNFQFLHYRPYQFKLFFTLSKTRKSIEHYFYKGLDIFSFYMVSMQCQWKKKHSMPIHWCISNNSKKIKVSNFFPYFFKNT